MRDQNKDSKDGGKRISAAEDAPTPSLNQIGLAAENLSDDLEKQARVVATVMATIPDFAYIFDRDGRFIYANKALLDLWGLKLEDAVGKNFYDLKYPDDLAAKLQQQIQQVLQTRRPLSDKTPYTSPSGSTGYYEYIFAPVIAEDGSVEFVSGSTRDITELQLTVEALRHSEESFRQLADAMPQIVWAAKPDGTLDYYNRQWFEYINIDPTAIEQARWDLYVHPEDLQRAFDAWTQALRTGQPYGIEFRVKRAADRQYRWFLVRALPIRNEKGAITRWFGTCTDIEEQKRAESALRLSREQMEIVVKGANVGVWYCPLPFDKLIWDEKVKEHFHLAPDADVTIETFYQRLHPDDRERTRQTIEQSINQRKPYDIDYRTVSPDGRSVKWVRASGRGFYDAAGNPTRFDGITIDVTERLAAEQKVREESNVIETINRVGRSVAAELNLDKLVQTVTDATTQLSGAQFGAFFYNIINERGESYLLYTLSGVDRANFDKFPMPRNTEVFAPTFSGAGIVRLADVTVDPRYGHNDPHYGMPKGHLPVRSYLAVPVVSRSGEVLGALFFGHAEVGVFTERS
ncbi:MAG TPA: PAS domain-containing protein, partial [Tepidisphaeraceae bacterium]|nr:PAS domain-containing protein [Tepidisphaeraceae bacterium]